MKIACYCLIASLGIPQVAFAWGRVGHRTVADIAESRLTPQTMRAVKQLLAVDHDRHLADVASWADTIKTEHRPDAPAHSLRLPLDHSTTVDQTLCPSGYCAVKGLNDYIKELGDASLSLEQRETALKFVVHLVGDIHQPLHASVATGGNVAVILDGKSTRLHAVWDDDIITDTHGRDPEAIAQVLEARADKSGLFFGGDPTTWALESRDISRDVIFKDVPTRSTTPVALPDTYPQTMWPIVAARLIQAGVRLANVLNAALK